MELTHQVHDRFAVGGVQVTGRLIREDNRRVADDGACYRDTLLLATGKLRWEVFGAMRHPDFLEGIVHALFSIGGRHAPVGERQLHVLVDGEITNQVECLEDEADFTIPDPGALGKIQVVRRLVVEHVRAAGRRVEKTEDGKKRRFAASRRSGDRNVFSLFDVDVNARESVRLHLVGVENLGDSFEMNECGLIVSHFLVALSSVISSVECDRRHPTPTCRRG